MRRRLALAALLAGLAAVAAAELQPIPPLAARVTDLTGTLDAGARDALEQKLAAFEARKGAQVAVLIVATTQPEAIEQYGIRVADVWKLGRAASDDGALLLVAKDDRALRIEVGYGLEGALSDLVCKRIIDEAIVPRFRAGDFAGGIEAGVDRMLRVIEGEPLPPPPARAWDPDPIAGLERALPVLFVGVPIGAAVLRRLLGAVLGPLAAGALAFALAWALTGIFFLALALALFAALFTALAGMRSSGRFRGARHHGWGGGFGGGRGGFGGGFSGGGGGFGGGGASGRW